MQSNVTTNTTTPHFRRQQPRGDVLHRISSYGLYNMGAAGSSAAAIDPAAIAKSLNDGTISALSNVAGLYKGSPLPSYVMLR